MNPKLYSIILDRIDYNILKNNSMIMTCCGSFFKKVEMKANKVELSVTEYQLKKLTGFVASEANHAESKKKENELGRIFDQLEAALNSLD